jgi:hypothetical protein
MSNGRLQAKFHPTIQELIDRVVELDTMHREHSGYPFLNNDKINGDIRIGSHVDIVCLHKDGETRHWIESGIIFTLPGSLHGEYLPAFGVVQIPKPNFSGERTHGPLWATVNDLLNMRFVREIRPASAL